MENANQNLVEAPRAYRDERTDRAVENQTPLPEKMWGVSIEEMDRGYLVRVGCKSIAISTKDELLTRLVQYLNDPQAISRKYLAGELFKDK